MTIHVLKSKQESNSQIARVLGVTEGAVRYHLSRGKNAADGRSERAFKAQHWEVPIKQWMEDRKADKGKRQNLKVLFEWLKEEHGYTGSYPALWRYVRAQFPKPLRRPYRRVETPPGVQAQVDWMEERQAVIGGVLITLYAFVMTLSYCRMAAVIWCTSMKQLQWHAAHNEAFTRLGGIPAVVRIDNLKTGVSRGAGVHGEINPAYAQYAAQMGFHIDPCRVRHPEAKGKVESRVGKVRDLLDVRNRTFDSLEQLQELTDARLEKWSKQTQCPVTGSTVHDSWREEIGVLRPLPLLPEPYDIVVNRTVYKDCTLAFEAHTYSVPFELAWKTVEVRGCATTVQIHHDGRLWAEHPRHTPNKFVHNPDHYEGEDTADRKAPLPLGKLGKKIAELAADPVQRRAMDYFTELSGVLQ